MYKIFFYLYILNIVTKLLSNVFWKKKKKSKSSLKWKLNKIIFVIWNNWNNIIEKRELKYSRDSKTKIKLTQNPFNFRYTGYYNILNLYNLSENEPCYQ